MEYYLGLDLGGTEIKAAVTEASGLRHGWAQVETNAGDGVDAVVARAARAARQAIQEAGIPAEALVGAGVGIPGLIKGPRGPVVFAPNLGWSMVDAVPLLEQALGIPTVLGNDAACAALAEGVLGAGKDYENILLLTLGTAVGGAVVFGGRPFDGFGPYGGELGHIPLFHGGAPCSCGLEGCFEQYGSANALVWQTRQLAEGQTTSLLWARCEGDLSRLNSVMIFEAAAQGDGLALRAVEQFTTYLAEGIAGLVNIFRPDAVVLGGGLSNAGSLLFDPVNRKVFSFTYASELIGAPPVLRAALGDSAGAVGAALLAADR